MSLNPNSTTKVQVNVGRLADMGKRFVSAWKQAEAGKAVNQINQTHITFLDVQTMFETLSPRRLDLLRHVRQHGAGNVREGGLKGIKKGCFRPAAQ